MSGKSLTKTINKIAFIALGVTLSMSFFVLYRGM